MKVKSNWKFEAKYSFLTPLPQNFEVLTPRDDVINTKNSSKRSKLVFHALMVMERLKSKVKGTFRWGIRLWNFFLEILKFKCHVVTSSSQNWIHNNFGSKIFFWQKNSEFWNIDPHFYLVIPILLKVHIDPVFLPQIYHLIYQFGFIWGSL